jgi:hypothetical protein
MKLKLIIVNGVIVAVALLAMLWGSTYSVPDLVRVSYGLPLTWGVNTINTIAGPVDKWSIDLPVPSLLAKIGISVMPDTESRAHQNGRSI